MAIVLFGPSTSLSSRQEWSPVMLWPLLSIFWFSKSQALSNTFIVKQVSDVESTIYKKKKKKIVPTS